MKNHVIEEEPLDAMEYDAPTAGPQHSVIDATNSGGLLKPCKLGHRALQDNIACQSEAPETLAQVSWPPRRPLPNNREYYYKNKDVGDNPATIYVMDDGVNVHNDICITSIEPSRLKVTKS